MANKNISGDVNVEFTEAQSRRSLESGESVKTLFGKLRKWLTDLNAVAFSGSYNDLSNKPSIPSTEVTETLDTTPYIYKSSEHDAVYDELVGGSVAWNQLIPTTGTSGDNSGVIFTNNGDGSWTLNGTTTGNNVFRNLNYTANKKNFINNHKYLIYANSDDSNVGIGIVRDTGSAQYTYGQTARIINYAEGSETASWARIQLSVSGYKVTNVITKPQVFDLTQMFGSTTIADYAYNLEQSTAGSGIAWLKSYGFFTKDYYPYNAGTLMSVNVSGKKVVGKNLLEITTESTTINGVTFTVDKATGTITANGTASANTFFAWKFTVEKGSYILSGCPTGGSINYYRIDIRNNVAGVVIPDNAIDVGTGTTALNLTEDTDYYLNIRIQSGYITNNLVFKPMIRRADITDSTFEPYTSITYPIQSTDLRGLYKLNGTKLYTDGDIYSADGTVTRKYGIVDLGTLNWGMTTNNRFYANVEQGSTGIITNALCTNYVVTNTAFSNLQDKEMNYGQPVASAGWRAVAVRDSTYSDATTFKTAMSGVYLIYELATPTTEPVQPFTSPQMVYRSGTEEYLDTRDVPMPVGGNRKYVDIPDWMVNEYFDDVRAEASMALPTTGGIIEGDLDVNGLLDVHNAYVRDDLTVGENLTVYRDLTVNPDNSINCKHISRTVGGRTAEIFLENLPAIDFYVTDSNVSSHLHLTSEYFGVHNVPIIYPDAPTGTGTSLALDSSYNIVKVTSSRDTKHDINYVEDTNSYHDALMQLKPATFIYNSDKTETQKLGMIAEDVADVCPIAGMTDKDGKVENYDDRAIIAMLVAEVQRLNAEIDKLKGR